MRIYGLTGGIASGKSEAAKRFQARGIPVIDADRVGHRVLEPGGTAEARVMDAFGEDILTDGQIDRHKLGARVFADPKELDRLNAIVQPAIKNEIWQQCAALARDGQDLAVIDASFISLQQVLPATLGLLQPEAAIVALVKPQFEADHADVSPGGVVREPAIHRQVVAEMMAVATTLRLAVKGLTVSPAPGPAGNIEFLLWLQKSVAQAPAPQPEQWDGWLDRALAQAAALVKERAARRSSGER